MQSESIASKVCTKCGFPKPLKAFYRCCGYADGRSRTCIECERAYKRRPDRMAAARESATASHKRKQARRRGVPATLTKGEWDRALAYFGGCAYCGSTEGTMHMDHFIPESRGGAFTADNLVPACASCNYRKHQRMPQDWCTPETYARVLAYFSGLDLVPNGDRPLRAPGYATGERHGSVTHPDALPRGEAHYTHTHPERVRHGTQLKARLTEEQVREIRRIYAAGNASQSELADEYGVSQTRISWIIRRKAWSHIE